MEGDKERGDQRRWLIGITITVLFGLFGVVMALLAYHSRESIPATPAAAPPPPAAPGPAHGRGHSDKDKGHGRE